MRFARSRPPRGARAATSGMGVGTYVEATAPARSEGCSARLEGSGKLVVSVGLPSQGQGHETTFAQIAADVLGCTPADVVVRTGNAGGQDDGIGTFGSRGLLMARQRRRPGGRADPRAAGRVRVEPARGEPIGHRHRGRLGLGGGHAGPAAAPGHDRDARQPLRLPGRRGAPATIRHCSRRRRHAPATTGPRASGSRHAPTSSSRPWPSRAACMPPPSRSIPAPAASESSSTCSSTTAA